MGLDMGRAWGRRRWFGGMGEPEGSLTKADARLAAPERGNVVALKC
jgi:hypothetical protein